MPGDGGKQVWVLRTVVCVVLSGGFVCCQEMGVRQAVVSPWTWGSFRTRTTWSKPERAAGMSGLLWYVCVMFKASFF